MSRTFTAEEITDILVTEFAAPLILTTLGWIIYGINLCQFLNYLLVLAKRDHTLTKIWVSAVMILNSAACLHNVYFDWSFSITGFTAGATSQLSHLNGNVVALYSVVVMLVQMFWLGCVNRLLASRPKLSWALTIPIGFTSFAAFVLAVSVAVLSQVDVDGPNWPTPLISILLRIVLALDLLVDLSILVVIVNQLALMRRSSVHLKRTVSKLSYIFCGVTALSTLIMIGELVINAPVATSSYVKISITLAPLIPPVYTTGMLSVLNARTDLWLTRRHLHISQDEGKGLIPGLNFTVELPTTTTDIPLADSPTTNSPEYYGNERAESIPGFAKEKENQFDANGLNESEA